MIHLIVLTITKSITVLGLSWEKPGMMSCATLGFVLRVYVNVYFSDR